MNTKNLLISIISIEAVLALAILLLSMISSPSWIFSLVIVTILLLVFHFYRVFNFRPTKNLWVFYASYVLALSFLCVILFSSLFNTAIFAVKLLLFFIAEAFLLISIMLLINGQEFFGEKKVQRKIAPVTPYYFKEKSDDDKKAIQKLRERFQEYELEKRWKEIQVQDELITKELQNVKQELNNLKKEDIKLIDYAKEELKEKTKVQKHKKKYVKKKAAKTLKKRKEKSRKKQPWKTEDFFAASTTGNKFHRLSCVLAKKLPSNKQIIFNQLNEALGAGYKPCNVCFPMPEEDKDKTLVSSKESEVFHRPSCIVAKKIPKSKRVYYRGERLAIKSKKKPCELCRPLAE